jgi:hypothetical protein
VLSLTDGVLLLLLLPLLLRLLVVLSFAGCSALPLLPTAETDNDEPLSEPLRKPLRELARLPPAVEAMLILPGKLTRRGGLPSPVDDIDVYMCKQCIACSKSVSRLHNMQVKLSQLQCLHAQTYYASTACSSVLLVEVVCIM